MSAQDIANIISSISAGISAISAIITLTAVFAAYKGIRENREQARKDREHAEKLAQEEQQYQGKPILAPVSNISNFAPLPNRIEPIQEISIQNIGNGAAFNVHCVLYCFNNIKYSSWNNGPVSTDSSPCKIILDNGPDNINMGMTVGIDGKYHLYNDGDERYRPARLTMTYRDLFNILHVSVFDYVVPAPGEYRWVQLAIKSGVEKDLEDLDYERVQSARRIKPDH